MAKCKFCTEARESLDTIMEKALAGIDNSITALDSLQVKMAQVKWGRRANPGRTEPQDFDRRSYPKRHV